MGDLSIANVSIIGLTALGIGVLGLVVALTSLLSLMKARRTYKKLTAGNKQANIEQLLMEIRDRYDGIMAEQIIQRKTMEQIQEQLKTMKSRVGIHRYNAFESEGNDLSFSIAMLDEEANGVVLTGIHSREQTYLYAKPIDKGQSKYHLSPEEKETITRTLR